ncbi:MAG: homogentisate phytyltransferase/homogentisate geranylgeranyltransferase [Flammeovirgaceae bacterium]|jgi:homogentisate phytyltransferase/homogentisate geranylgeranyltransferase
MRALKTLWEFTRPHTIIGSAISVTALYLMAIREWEFSFLFTLSLVAALLCNVFITGYNQLVDIDLDRVNKPELPLPAGNLSVTSARIIVFGSLISSLLISAYASFFLLGLVATISALGFIYSWKRVYLKRRHQTAAFAIVIVRGVLINLGFYALYSGGYDFPIEIWTLTVFVILFSAGIAWFKDIPDIEGDAQVAIGSLAIEKGAGKAFSAGVWLLGLAYSSAALAPLFFDFQMGSGSIITIGHAILGIAFLSLASKTNPLEKKQMKRFYLSFWVLFFLEYVLWVASVFATV